MDTIVYDCPICYETIISSYKNSTILMCCGQYICIKCADSIIDNKKRDCPFCRQITPYTNKEIDSHFEAQLENNKAWAQFRLGQDYLHGFDREKNMEKAFHWYKKAADQGYSYALTALGRMYISGDYIEESYSKVFKLFTLASKEDPVAMFALANLYYLGLGCDASIDISFKLLNNSADKGFIPAMEKTAEIYMMEYLNEDVKESLDKSYTYLIKILELDSDNFEAIRIIYNYWINKEKESNIKDNIIDYKPIIHYWKKKLFTHTKNPKYCEEYTVKIKIELEKYISNKCCSHCNKEFNKYAKKLHCSVCEFNYYCSKSCSLANWKLFHKNGCNLVKEAKKIMKDI